MGPLRGSNSHSNTTLQVSVTVSNTAFLATRQSPSGVYTCRLTRATGGGGAVVELSSVTPPKIFGQNIVTILGITQVIGFTENCQMRLQAMMLDDGFQRTNFFFPPFSRTLPWPQLPDSHSCSCMRPAVNFGRIQIF
jgi:hypothetical protein